MANRAIKFDQFVHTLLSLFLRLLSSFFRFLLLIRILGEGAPQGRMRAGEHWRIALQFQQNRNCSPALIRLLRFAPQPPSPRGRREDFRRSKASPMRGSCRRRRLMRWTASRKRNCPTSSVTAPPCHLPLIGEGFGACKSIKLPRKKVQPDKLRLHLLLTADIQRQLPTNLVSRIRRRVAKHT